MTGHAHDHPASRDLEDGPLTYHMALTEAVSALLQSKGVFTADELRRTVEAIDSRSPADGALLVAHAWVDAGFRQRLLADVNAAAAELGIDAGGIPIRAVENGPGVHNVIVCTLCSCYPRMLLGPSPDWYKSRAYRSRVVREPRAVLAEFGLELAPGLERGGPRQHGRAALPGRAAAARRDRWLARGASRRPSHPRLHDRDRRPAGELRLSRRAPQA